MRFIALPVDQVATNIVNKSNINYGGSRVGYVEDLVRNDKTELVG